MRMRMVNGEIRVYDIKTGKLIRKLIGHKNTVSCLKVLSNGTVASGSDDGQIRIWNPANGTLIRKIDSYDKPVTCIVDLLDERIASIYHADNTVKICNIRTDL